MDVEVAAMTGLSKEQVTCCVVLLSTFHIINICNSIIDGVIAVFV